MTRSDRRIRTSPSGDRFRELVEASIEARAQGSTDRAKQLAIAAIELAPTVSASGELANVIEVFDSGFLSPLSVSAVRRALYAASGKHVRLLAESKFAQVHYFTHGEYDHSVRWARSAADGLLELGELRAASRALNRLALVHFHEGLMGDAQSEAERALDQSVEVGVPIDASLAHNTLSKIGLLSGVPESAISHAERGLLYAEEAGIDLWIVANLFAMAMALVALGRLSEASEALNEAMGKPSNRSEVLLGIALVSAYSGDQRRAREYLAEAESRFGKSPDRETRETFTRLKLTYAGELARFGIDVMPIQVVCRQLSRFVDGPVTPHIRLSLACAYGQAAAAHGDAEDVERASTLLGSFSTPVSGGELRPPILMNRIRADLELAKQNRDAPLYRSSFRSEIDSAYPLEHRLLETQVSRLTIRDQVTPDRNEIRINVDGLQTWFEGHSAHGFRFLIDSARQELQARRGGRPLYPAGLTEREVEVLRLLSAGLTNRQIADQLTLSVHTVGQHVRNIYSKTGLSNRAQATAFARGEGLAESSQQLEQR